MKTLKPIKWVKKGGLLIGQPDGIAEIKSLTCGYEATFSPDFDYEQTDTLEDAKAWCQEQLQTYYESKTEELKEIESEVGFEDTHTN